MIVIGRSIQINGDLRGDEDLRIEGDVTGTVESVPLITASILSKKIAAGLQGLVMDVKVGTGAFMQSIDEAQELAASIIGTAARAGLQTHAVITDMNEVLGSTASNALEIAEAVRFLRDDVRERRLNEVTLALQNAGEHGGSVAMTTRFDAVDPMPWATGLKA